jgi:hypothetical protein
VSRRARRRSTAARQPRTTPSRINRGKVLGNLRIAARKGDRAALALALEEMRTLALSPRYWERYLALLDNPLARLADLLAIKQGERIAHLKGWKLPRAARAPSTTAKKPAGRAADGAERAGDGAERARDRGPRGRRQPPSPVVQPSLFELG